MDITPLIRRNQQVIQTYKSGVFKISNVVYDHPVYVDADEVLCWNISGCALGDIKPAHLHLIEERAGSLDVVLFGTGSKSALLPDHLRDAFCTMGVAVDSMNTGAACRTFNVLMAEGRRVSCLLIPYL
ncbi:MAG: Mth938-like domain-containing protein [Alphaproteobacteria bacterium]